jgi:peptidoglycan/xylan/chitin deacetylase (PgdA/CDA1 family)
VLNLLVRIIKQFRSICYFSSAEFGKTCKKYARKGRYLILGYHRIRSPSPDQYMEPGMYVNPASFRKQMEVIGKYFEIVSLEKVCKGSICNEKPSCVLTFDDGWNDFYTNAYPVLKKYRYPATVFLPTGYIGSNRMLWTDALARLMVKRKFDAGFLLDYVKDESIRKKLNKKYNRSNLHDLIHLVKTYSIEHNQEIYRNILMENDLMNECNSDFLTWEQIFEMKESGLIHFGSHTSEHVILTSVSVERARAELHHSRELLLNKKLVCSDFIPFCYPNGTNSKVVAEEVKSAGYSCAVTVRRRWNDLSTDIYGLNRIGMHQDVSFSPSMTVLRLGSTPVDNGSG